MEKSEMSISDIVTNEEDKKILEPVPTKKRNRAVIGVVNCDSLFLRDEPDSDGDVIHIMKKDDTVSIDINGSTNDFYKATVDNVSGFCMKKFITIQ